MFPRRHGKARDSDEEHELDDEDAVASAVGCLGPFSGFLAPELQKYQKQIKGKGGLRVIVLVHLNKGLQTPDSLAGYCHP